MALSTPGHPAVDALGVVSSTSEYFEHVALHPYRLNASRRGLEPQKSLPKKC
jgi:hypothetical protein